MQLAGVGILAIACGAWIWRRRRSRKVSKVHDDPPDGIVLLLRNPKPVNVELLSQILSRASGQPVKAIRLREKNSDADEPAGKAWVAGEPPHFIVFLEPIPYTVHSLPSPYWENSAAASEEVPELRLRKAVREHKAWLSVDILHPESASPEAYRLVGRALAELIGPDCLALYHPPTNRMAAYSEETGAKLRSDNPIKELFEKVAEVPVVPVEQDPRMRAAEAEARARFPEFEAAFAKHDGSLFAVKTLVTRGTRSEHIWVQVDTIGAEYIEGRLGNEPVELEGLRLGSKVKLRRDQVEDWSFLRDGAPVGLFTVPVIQQIYAEKSRASPEPPALEIPR